MVVAKLKSLSCSALGDRLVVSLDPRVRFELADPDGRVARLLALLAEGGRTAEALAVELDVPEPDIRAALDAFDGLGWLHDATARSTLTAAQRERHFSNLAFLEGFSTLTRSSSGMQERVLAAHVVVLGTGGLGAGAVQHLVGLGVGRLTLLDFDVVEARNFARQFTYTPAQLGRSKVAQVAAWAAAFDPAVSVTALHQRVVGPETVAALLDGVDLVVSAIDQPDEVDLWVNEACVAAGVPFIRGGLAYLQGLYWSVDPGVSACRQCLETYRSTEPERDERAQVVSWPLLLRQDQTNRATGPVAGILAGLVSMEALRYLTGFVPPVSAGTYQLVDFTGACEISSDPWPADPHCSVCATAPKRAR
jgi:molybdopterin/thiamine biosynthesis adenylyltransferase